MPVVSGWTRTFVYAALALGLAGCHRVPDVVKIGVAQPLSGPLGPLGSDLLHGVEMAADELNAKQGLVINGKAVRIEVVAVDDKANPDEGKKAAHSLVDAGVVAVIGHLNSGVSIPAAPIYAAKNIPQLAISTKPEYTQLGLPTTFRLVGNDDMQSKALGQYAAKRVDGKIFALVDDGTPYGKGLAELAAKEMQRLDVKPVLRRSLDDKSTDFAQLVAELKAAKVDTYVTTQSDFQVRALIEQLIAAQMENVQILGSDTIKTNLLPEMARSVRAVYATTPIIGAREFRSSRDFLGKFVERYKSDPTYGAHYTYDAVYVLAAAMRRAESVDPKDLTRQLKQLDALAPVTNNVRFRDNGEQYYPMISVYRIDAHGWTAVSRSDSW